MAKNIQRIQIPVATYDRLEKNCIACLGGIDILYTRSGFYHYMEEEEGYPQYSKCGNSDTYTDLFKGLSTDDKEAAANEVLFILGESRLISMRSEVQEVIQTTPKSKLIVALADLCEDYFRRGLIEGVERTSALPGEETGAG